MKFKAKNPNMLEKRTPKKKRENNIILVEICFLQRWCVSKAENSAYS